MIDASLIESVSYVMFLKVVSYYTIPIKKLFAYKHIVQRFESRVKPLPIQGVTAKGADLYSIDLHSLFAVTPCIYRYDICKN